MQKKIILFSNIVGLIGLKQVLNHIVTSMSLLLNLEITDITTFQSYITPYIIHNAFQFNRPQLSPILAEENVRIMVLPLAEIFSLNAAQIRRTICSNSIGEPRKTSPLFSVPHETSNESVSSAC